MIDFAFVHKRAIMRAGSVVLLGIVALPIVVALSPSALGVETDSKVAVLSVSGPQTFSATLSGGQDKGKAVQQATVRPVITNTGTAGTDLSFEASLDNVSGDCALSLTDIDISTDPEAPLPLAAGGSVAPAVTMSMPATCAGSSGTLVISGDDGAAPATVRFTLGRDIGENVYWWPVISALAAAVLYVAAMLLYIWLGRKNKFGRLTDEVATGPGWSFHDSWLTNIAALGAILGTVLSAGGFLGAILPGVSTGRFLGLSLLFGAFVTVAPVIYSAASKWEWSKKDGPPDTLVPVGRIGGVIFAAGATMAGVFGELGTLATLNAEAAGNQDVKILIYVLLATAAIVAIVYAVSFVREVSLKEKSTTDNKPTLRPVSGTL